MSLEEVFAEDPQVSRSRAVRTIKEHNSDVDAFLYEMGEQSSYSSRAVLEWLGY